MPPRKEASSTMMKPSRLNWVDSNVNMKRPPEMSRTTRMSRGFWAEDREDDQKQANGNKRHSTETTPPLVGL